MEGKSSEKLPVKLQSQDFDMMSAFDWKDGIATLPGSNIQFRINEFGTLELLTEAEARTATAVTPANKTTFVSGASGAASSGTGSEGESERRSQNSQEFANGLTEVVRVMLPSSFICRKVRVPGSSVPEDDVAAGANVWHCENCGRCGNPASAANGKYCGENCAQKHSRSVANPTLESERPLKRLRRKRKLLLDSGDEEEENAEDEEEKGKLNNSKGRRGGKQIKPVSSVPSKKKAWNWNSYLDEEKMEAVPVKLFREYQSFPQGKNGFKIGMRLEGLDPEHPSLFCVLTVSEVQGYRIRLHFDGYSECYDFWVNADSPDIHPISWCEKTGHKLLPPKGYKDGEFDWPSYLKTCRAQGAPKSLFRSVNTPVTPSGFRVGMKLEAVDRKNPTLMCVATIADMVDNRLLIHFDNWDQSYDYWCDASSPYIRPVGYCQEAGLPLTTPPDYKDPKRFSWERYLGETASQAAPARAFKLRPPHGFQVNTKLEAVDKRNPILIRVATIVDRDDHRIKLHFDGWNHNYDYWVDADSFDIHPVGWCSKTGHPLQLPLGYSDSGGVTAQGCPTPGCQGIGHVRGPRYGTHYTLVSCPYSETNMNRENFVQDRLSGERPLVNVIVQKKRAETPTLPADTLDDSPQSKVGRTHACLKIQLVKQEGESGKDAEFSLQQALHQSVFMSSFSSNPSHRLQLCWDQHCKLLPEVAGLTAKGVAKWTTEEVASFVQRLPGCKDQASIFREEQIDGEAFLLLTQSDIVKILSIKLGPALKIYNAILMFKSAEDD
uniref:L3MBTL histone methyl-lysine binding protein 1b n=1 Tax=Latimeria chalumnae TaxID=7897 RepID=H3AK66_LATCH